MTIKDVQKVVAHSREGSVSDIRSAKLLLAGKQLLQSLFFCHLAIEKSLKALIVRETKDHFSLKFTPTLTKSGGGHDPN